LPSPRRSAERHDQPVAANLLDRRFEAERPNQRWVGNVTEILTAWGKLYLAGVPEGNTDGAGSSLINQSTESGQAQRVGL
jgi:hypothetical protein